MLSFDGIGNFLDNLPSTSLPMDGGMILPHNQAPLLSRVVPSTMQPLPGMCLVTINTLRPRTDLYMSRLPCELRRGACFHQDG